MGIMGIKKLIGEIAVERTLADYSGMTLAIDTSIFLYQFIYRDDDEAVLKGILKQLQKFHRYQITPVYVFDGKASSNVKIEVKRRQEQREKVRNTLETLEIELGETLETLGDPVAAASVMIDIDTLPVGNVVVEIPFQVLDIPMFYPDSDDDEMEPPIEDTQFETTEDLMMQAVKIQSRIHSLQKQTRRPTREMIEDCKQLFEILGVAYVQAPGEADPTLGEMVLNGEVDGIISEDTDMLPYGCEIFITRLSGKNDNVIEFRLSRALELLAMTREQFVDLCILCGCDYADKIYKIGVKTGYSLLKKHPNIEAILKHIDETPKLKLRHTYSEGLLSQVQVARNMFLKRNPNGDPPEENASILKHSWNFQIAEAMQNEYFEFLSNHKLKFASYKNLCKQSVAPKPQRTMMDFFKLGKKRSMSNDKCLFE